MTKLLENSAEVAPEFPWSRNDLAWVLATTREESRRDGERALVMAMDVCKQDQWHYHGFMDTLAAAYGEVGNYDKAVELMGNAIKKSPQAFHAGYEDKLQSYKRGESLVAGAAETA